MGDGANGLLGWYAAKGYYADPNYIPRKRPRTKCPECGKSVEASEGFNMHIKAKHRRRAD